MKHWDPESAAAPVAGVPIGCKAVPLVELTERDGDLVEVRDRRGRTKSREVVLVADRAHPRSEVDDDVRLFALATGRRRWSTIRAKYGDRAFDVATELVRADVVHLGCVVDERGVLGEPMWWRPTQASLAAAERQRAEVAARQAGADAERARLADELRGPHPDVAVALEAAISTTAIDVLTAAGSDLLAGVVHAGPRAFVQSHFAHTKAHDVRGVLLSAGVGLGVLDRLGLRRGDRIGLGGPIVVTTDAGRVDLAPLRGPVTVRLDQHGLDASTDRPVLVVVENLQPAETLCAQYADLAVVYTAGQFGDDAAHVLRRLTAGGARVVAITDADLGGVRIAHRVRQACPHAEIVDVGRWPHPERPRFPVDGATIAQLDGWTDDPLVGDFAAGILARGYPVEQELATLDIVRSRITADDHLLRRARRSTARARDSPSPTL